MRPPKDAAAVIRCRNSARRNVHACVLKMLQCCFLSFLCLPFHCVWHICPQLTFSALVTASDGSVAHCHLSISKRLSKVLVFVCLLMLSLLLFSILISLSFSFSFSFSCSLSFTLRATKALPFSWPSRKLPRLSVEG